MDSSLLADYHAPGMSEDVFELLGAVIDKRYRIDSVVGEGGFGVVYRGWHLAFSHPIAVKCLKVPAHFTRDAKATFLDKFRGEGAFLSRLSAHPAIVRVFDLNVIDREAGQSVPYLVLEWLEGRELADWLLERRRSGGGAMSEAEAIALLRPAVEALALAHKLKIAHRDLKPQNLYLTETHQGVELKVLDFGIAKAMQEGETATRLATGTSSTFHAFTPDYGAPEQFVANKFGATGPWTDVYALGLILTELVLGRRVYSGDALFEFYEEATSEKRPTPRAKGATVSDAFDALCAKALSASPAERFQDAGQFLVALDQGSGLLHGLSQTGEAEPSPLRRFRFHPDRVRQDAEPEPVDALRTGPDLMRMQPQAEAVTARLDGAPVPGECGAVVTEEQEVIHVAQIASDAEAVLGQVVYWGQVVIGKVLAREVPNGQACPALVRREETIVGVGNELAVEKWANVCAEGLKHDPIGERSGTDDPRFRIADLAPRRHARSGAAKARASC